MPPWVGTLPHCSLRHHQFVTHDRRGLTPAAAASFLLQRQCTWLLPGSWAFITAWGGEIALPYHSRAGNPHNTPRRADGGSAKCPLHAPFTSAFALLQHSFPHRPWEPCQQVIYPVCLLTELFQNTRKSDSALSILGCVMPPHPSMLRMFCCLLKQDSSFEKQNHGTTDAQSRSKGLLPTYVQVPGAAFYKGQDLSSPPKQKGKCKYVNKYLHIFSSHTV